MYNPFVSLAFGAQFSCFSLVVAFVVGSLVCNAIFQHARPFCYCLFCFCFIRCYCCVVIAVIVVISFAICISRFFFFCFAAASTTLTLLPHTRIHQGTHRYDEKRKQQQNNCEEAAGVFFFIFCDFLKIAVSILLPRFMAFLRS